MSAIPPTPEAQREAFELAEQILRGIEVDDVRPSKLVLKAARIARLLNDFESEQLFRWEASGYPTTATGMPADAWAATKRANRRYQQTSVTTKAVEDYAYLESVDALEQELDAAKTRLQVIGNAPVSGDVEIRPFMPPPHIAWAQERSTVQDGIRQLADKCAARRALLHDYALTVYTELRFSGIAADIFARVRERVDRAVGERVPDSVRKFSSVYENLASTNPEDWSNAVHSCRRILQDLADALFPARADLIIDDGGRPRTISLGPDNYINRLIAFIEERTDSKRYSEIVGSHLRYIGERLDAVFAASQKGSHSNVTREEADRYVIFTYLLVGDVLALAGEA